MTRAIAPGLLRIMGDEPIVVHIGYRGAVTHKLWSCGSRVIPKSSDVFRMSLNEARITNTALIVMTSPSGKNAHKADLLWITDAAGATLRSCPFHTNGSPDPDKPFILGRGCISFPLEFGQ
jgi:hypothetical protein